MLSTIFMRSLLIIFLVLLSGHFYAQNNLPVYNSTLEKNHNGDWLIIPVTDKAAVYKSADGKDIILYNGLVKRTFRMQPNVVCIDYKNMSNGQQLLRSIKPEAEITIDSINYSIGGLYGQTENAYLLPEWLDNFIAHDSDFHFTSYEVNNLKP